MSHVFSLQDVKKTQTRSRQQRLTNSASLKRWLPGEVEGGQQLAIMIDPGILRRQKLIPIKDRVCPGEQTEGLRLFREPGPPGGQPDLRLG